MALRDRRGPLTALVLATAYLMLLVDGLLIAAELAGWQGSTPLSPVLRAMVIVSFFGFVWRAGLRAAFTGREYGAVEGFRAVLRIPVGNVIAIMAGRRAIGAYLRSLRTGRVAWDKTAHDLHPAAALRVVRT
jgi:bacteriophage N4 adsorption protein B